MWVGIAFGLGLGVAAQFIPAARIPGPRWMIRLVGLVLLVGGVVVRWAAIVTLGRHFTVDVAIRPDHAVVQTGLYRIVRHPSYTGLLLAFLGLGVSFVNWLGILVLLVPIALAVLNRARKEEDVLLSSLGSVYGACCARTKRFIPGLL